jgi:hypothetical protein
MAAMGNLSRQVRRKRRESVEEAYAQLRTIVGGDFRPGFFSRPEVLESQRHGLNVSEAVLGYILEAPRDERVGSAALDLVRRVSESVRPNEVATFGDDLHLAVSMLLNRIGCPSVVVWGCVVAQKADSQFRVFADVMAPSSQGNTGHSWVFSPYWQVADLRLAQLREFGSAYESLRATIPGLIVTAARKRTEPPRNNFQKPGPPREKVSHALYAEATRYQDVLGWTHHLTEQGLSIAYLPAGVMLPDAEQLAALRVRIGGLELGRFLEEKLGEIIAG